MGTNAMGREAANPGRGTAGGAQGRSNADRDRGAVRSMNAAMAGAGRPQRTANTDFITPKYSWDQAQLSDFGITGALMNAFNGLYKGNTYAGRTPLGFTSGQLGGPGGGAKFTPNPAFGVAKQVATKQLAAPVAPFVSPFAQSLVPRYKPGSLTSVYQGV